MKQPDLKYTSTSHSYVEQELRKLDVLTGRAYRLKISDWAEKRTLTANGQIHVFVKQISDFTSTDVKTAKAEVKIDFGLPIILAKEDEYSIVVDYILDKADFYKMSREQQCTFITAIAITSKLTTKESGQLLEQMVFYWNDKGLELKFLN